MIQKSTIDFLKKLQKNNNREWFDKNKALYEAAKEDVTQFAQKIIDEFSKNDPSLKGTDAKKCMFRIYRDVRFSKNKDPYKTNMGAWFNSEGKNGKKAGFYFHIEPEKSFIAGGIYMPEAPELKKIRQEIDYNAAAFRKIISNSGFKKIWGKLEGMKLVNPPKGYDKTHPEVELLKHTSFVVTHPISESELCDKGLLKKISAAHKAMIPFKQFLDAAVS